jgi:hypothetical protein
MNLLPILLIGGAAAVILTKKKPTKAIGGDDTGDDDTGGGEPAIGDTVAFNKTPMNGILWKVVRSPNGYMARWIEFTKGGADSQSQWQSAGEFDTAAEAQQRVVDMIGLGQIP